MPSAPVLTSSQILHRQLSPGSKAWIAQQFVTTPGDRQFVVSVGVVRGSRPGPTLTHIAGQHGMEHLGPIMLRDLFDEIDPRDVAGTLYICPAANPLALELDYEVYPEFDDRSKLKEYFFSDARPGHCVFGYGRNPERGTLNMNRLWPHGGDERSGVTGRIVRWLWETIVKPADIVVDHHALRADKPLIFCEDPAVPWTPFFGLEAVYSRPLPDTIDPFNHAILSLQATLHGKPGICVEYSKQHGLKDHERAVGRFAALNLMRAMGMLQGEALIPKPVWLIPNRFQPPGFVSLKSDRIGHLHFRVEEYQPLKQGQAIVEIRSIETHEVLEVLRAPSDALMLSRTWRAVSKPGDEVCRIQTDARLLAEPGKPFPVPTLPQRKEE